MRKLMDKAIVFLIEEADSLSRLELVVAPVLSGCKTDGKDEVVEGITMPLNRLDRISDTRNGRTLNFDIGFAT